MIWSSWEVSLFFFVVWVMGIGNGIISNFQVHTNNDISDHFIRPIPHLHSRSLSFYIFQFIYLQELGGDETLMGLSLTVNCIAELPLFFYSGVMIHSECFAITSYDRIAQTLYLFPN